MDRVDRWLNGLGGWRCALLVWLLVCPVAVAAGSMYYGWVTIDGGRLDPGFLGMAIAVALLVSIPVTGLLIVARRWWPARAGRGPLLSWRLLAAIPCGMALPIFIPVYQHLRPAWLHAHPAIMFGPEALSLVALVLAGQHARWRRRQRVSAGPAGAGR